MGNAKRQIGRRSSSCQSDLYGIILSSLEFGIFEWYLLEIEL